MEEREGHFIESWYILLNCQKHKIIKIFFFKKYTVKPEKKMESLETGRLSGFLQVVDLANIRTLLRQREH